MRLAIMGLLANAISRRTTLINYTIDHKIAAEVCRYQLGSNLALRYRGRGVFMKGWNNDCNKIMVA
jgi:hypothetical protein